MKDKEIIKELEYQVKYGAGNPKALDLINRQQAEIQTLREDIHNRKTRENKLRSKIKGFKTEIERLKKHNTEYARKHYNDGRAEAIKEFAERLKEHLKGNGGLFCVTTMNAQIDNLVKEMVGEQE
jgi:DNA repair exonuclease SbcCD ATPase subunit